MIDPVSKFVYTLYYFKIILFIKSIKDRKTYHIFLDILFIRIVK